MRSLLALLATVATLDGCASLSLRPERLSDGSYHLECNDTLASCMQAFEQTCAWYGYDVISASETRQHPEVSEIKNDTLISEAHVACKKVKALFESTPAAPAPAPAPMIPSPAPSVPSTSPPASQPG